MGPAIKDDFEIAPFRAFGPSGFWPFRRRLQTLDVTHDFALVRRSMRSECPRRPGVYGMLDAHGQLIYIGMSTVLPKRLVTYFQSGANERKEYRIASHTQRLVWEVIGHGLAAHLRELELIRRHLPRFNVKGRRAARALGFIYISREDAPRLRVAKQVPRGVRYSWGPLAMGWRVREAVDTVNKVFKLRDCRSATVMLFADQQNLFSLDLRAECVRGETGSCLGPCAGQCTRSQYTAQLRAVRAFLDGRDPTTLTRLEEDVKAAAASQQFERAARIRDKHVQLSYIADRLGILREPPMAEQFIYETRVGRTPFWYLVAASRVVAAMPVPADGVKAKRCLQRLQTTYNSRMVEQFTSDRLATQILAAWFRRNPQEAAARLTPGEAVEFCRRLQA
jgi:excinuclease ABC subunit C